jgi:hypothetical protein
VRYLCTPGGGYGSNQAETAESYSKEPLLRKARIQGSQTFVSLDARFESNEEQGEEEPLVVTAV